MLKTHDSFRSGTGEGGSQGGYTLAEVLATVAILGVLLAIAVVIFLGILEQRRVDAATDQLVSDSRLAHSRATAELTDWRIVLILDRGDESEGPDYYLMRLARPYGEGNAKPEVTTVTPKHFSGNVGLKNVKTKSGYLTDDRSKGYWLSPEESPPEEPTKTLEFNSDGTMSFFKSHSGSICVTADGRPQNRVVTSSATSRVRVQPESSCDTSEAGG